MPLQRRLLQPLYSRVLTSPSACRAWRSGHDWLERATGRPPFAVAWLRFDCPGSYLLSQKLPRLHEHFPIGLDIRLRPLRGDIPPAEAIDAWQLAQRHQLHFQSLTPPSPASCRLGERIVLATAGLPVAERLQLLRQLFTCVWEHQNGKLETLALRYLPVQEEDGEFVAPDTDDGPSATLVFRGERFEGLDDLPLLTKRLEAAGLGVGDPCETGGAPVLPTRGFLVNDSEMLARIRSRRYRLDFYFCFRDPYSYLNLDAVFALSDHYGLRLRLHPVTLPDIAPQGSGGLPDLQRLWRCARRAESRNLPFGRICLPDADAVQQSRALLGMAADPGVERLLVRELMACIWARGQDTGTARCRRELMLAAGLDKDKNTVSGGDAITGRQHWPGLDHPRLPALVLHTERLVTATGDDRVWALDMALADTLNL